MIVIASDHAGFDLKQEIMAHLRERGVEFEDVGTFDRESCHYPVFAEKAARGVVDGTWEKGILVCGTGLGMSMAANKIPGIRCALLSDCFSAEMARAHNDANMMALGGRVIGPELAKRIVDTFLNTGFMGGKHELRVNMIRDLEKK
jgi:ribose 5-phosphate isomerase B